MEKIGIRQSVKDGYIEMQIPGVCDLSYPTSNCRRGRVQGGGCYISNYNNLLRSGEDYQMEKEIIIIGTIGNTERQNRDDARVLGGGVHRTP